MRSALLALALVSLSASFAGAQAFPRTRLDVTGDFVVIGNTLGQSCGSEPPVVGTLSRCSQFNSDSSPNVFWRSETSSAAANPDIPPEAARSTAVLRLPPGARVVRAYLYWFASILDAPGDGEAFLDRPGRPRFTAQALRIHEQDQTTLDAMNVEYRHTVNYLSVADVTTYVQAEGNGPYRVSGVAAHPFADVSRLSQVGWTMVVIYQRPNDLLRNIAVYDGINRVSGSTLGISLSDFHIPDLGAYDGKVALLATDGEADGSKLLFGATTPLSAADAMTDPINPLNRFFNGSRSERGQAVSVIGDLPQLTGGPNSMSGIDLDLVDVGPRLTRGQTTARLEVTSTGSDGIIALVWVTSLATLKPDFSALRKTATPEGPAQLGSRVDFRIEAENSGNDTALEANLRDPLVAGLAYEPGSLAIETDGLRIPLSDGPGDDRGEYDSATRTIVVRLGDDATAAIGGALEPGQKAAVLFSVRIAELSGPLVNQAELSAIGRASALPETARSDGDPDAAGAQPTVVYRAEAVVDGGTPGGDGGTPGDDAASGAPRPVELEDAGCACESVRTEPSFAWALLALALLRRFRAGARS